MKKMWSKMFNLKAKAFKAYKNKYKFANIIKTDGISCCIIFEKETETKKILRKR